MTIYSRQQQPEYKNENIMSCFPNVDVYVHTLASVDGRGGGGGKSFCHQGDEEVVEQYCVRGGRGQKIGKNQMIRHVLGACGGLIN